MYGNTLLLFGNSTSTCQVVAMGVEVGNLQVVVLAVVVAPVVAVVVAPVVVVVAPAAAGSHKGRDDDD